MSERNHYEEAKLPSHMRKTLLRDVDYYTSIYVDPDNHMGWREDDSRIESVYVASDKDDREKDGTLWADERMEIEEEDYDLTNITGRVGLMKVLVFDGYSEEDILLADLRFVREPPATVNTSRPSQQEYESGWAEAIDSAIPVKAFIAYEENGEEAYYGSTIFKNDLEILREAGDARMKTREESIAEKSRQKEERARENEPDYQKES